jgi:hypothetical protein
MPTSKKIFIISSTIFAILLIFFGVYNFSFKKDSAPTKSPAANTSVTPANGSNASSAAKITALTDEAVLAPMLDTQASAIRYYSKSTGKAYRIDLDGNNNKTLSDQALPGLSDVVWSPDGTKAITKFVMGGTAKFFYYDYSTGTSTPLKSNLDTVVWQNNNKIFYKYYDPTTQERTLNIADPDGTNWNKIVDLSYKNVSIAPVPHTGLVSFWNSPDAGLETNFTTVPVFGGTGTSLLKGNFGTDYLWNPDGSAVLLSRSDQKNGSRIQLGVMNNNGGEFKDLGVGTFVSKSIWSKDGRTVYYALPGPFPANVTVPNDYTNGKFNTNDSFWKINVSTGEKKRILDVNQTTGKIDAADLFLNADESLLFFVNKIDGKLYKINL